MINKFRKRLAIAVLIIAASVLHFSRAFIDGNGSTTGTVDWSEDGSSKEAEMNATARLIIDKTVNSTGNEPPEHASDKDKTVNSTGNEPPELASDKGGGFDEPANKKKKFDSDSD